MLVRFMGDAWPSSTGLEKLFDTGDSWTQYREGPGYRLSLEKPGGDAPLWVARFDRGAVNVELFCPFGPDAADGESTANLPLTYPLDQLLLMHFLARRRGMLVHAAGMIHRGRTFLFAGVSGAGKSTFSELLVGAGIGEVLSDERMIVRGIDERMIAFGTPWAGTAGIARDGNAPLAGIFFLKHGKTNGIERLEATAAADRLLPVASIPWYDPDTATAIVAFAKDLAARAPAFAFHFTPDSSAADCLMDFLPKVF